MSHWLLEAIAERRAQALRDADRVQFYHEMTPQKPDFDAQAIHEVVAALELAVLDMELDRFGDDEAHQAVLHCAAADAFRLLRVLPLPEAPMAATDRKSVV